MILISVDHDREFLFKPRGFNSIQEHDAEIIRRWNSVVSSDDIVYHLGDVMLGDNNHGLECLRQLNGTIYIIPGNHDTTARIALYKTLPNVSVLEPLPNGLQPAAATMKYKKYSFYLSHHPTMTSNLEKAPYLRMHLINLFGHTHQQTNFYQGAPFMYHVGMDSHNCTPILLDDAIEDMKKETQKCLDLLQGVESLTNLRTPRCSKCLYAISCQLDNKDENQTCLFYKRDPLDGGYYN